MLGTLPAANWLDGGHDAPWFNEIASEWLSGTAIAVGTGLVLAILSRRFPYLWNRDLATRVAQAAEAKRWRTGIVWSASMFLLYATIARTVFDGRPLLIDELVQVMQAKIFARGLTSLPAPAHPEFFSILHVVDFGGRWYAQFPPGGPAMLVPGVMLGAPWLVGPICGALSVLSFWLLAPSLDPRPTVRLGATLVFSCAPFMLFMSGSHMNHVPTLMWSLFALLALIRVIGATSAVPLASASLGFCLGMMAAIRPVDGAALALPVGGWLLWRTCRGRLPLGDLLLAGTGVAIPLAGVLLFNLRTTGDPFLFGYELLWGKSHALGFHSAPWGVAHTPSRGLELLNLYFLRLQTYFLETPFPSLLPVLGALALGSLRSSLDRVLLWSGGLLLAGYFAYWHDGFYLGPRFMFPLMPLLALWSARFPAEVRRRSGPGSMTVRAVTFSLVAGAMIALCVAVPFRVRQYAGGLTSMRLDYTGPARRANVSNAIILVRESWGTQLVARMWALDVPRSETELLYRNVDTCLLEQRVQQLEQQGTRGRTAIAALVPLLRDSARVEKTSLSPDRTERMLPGTHYAPVCVTRISEDRAGFTLLAPLHAMELGSNVYARDLHARDTLLLKLYPERAVFLLSPQGNEIGAPLQLQRASVDSMRQAWMSERESAPRP